MQSIWQWVLRPTEHLEVTSWAFHESCSIMQLLIFYNFFFTLLIAWCWGFLAIPICYFLVSSLASYRLPFQDPSPSRYPHPSIGYILPRKKKVFLMLSDPVLATQWPTLKLSLQPLLHWSLPTASFFRVLFPAYYYTEKIWKSHSF